MSITVVIMNPLSLSPLTVAEMEAIYAVLWWTIPIGAVVLMLALLVWSRAKQPLRHSLSVAIVLGLVAFILLAVPVTVIPSGGCLLYLGIHDLCLTWSERMEIPGLLGIVVFPAQPTVALRLCGTHQNASA